MKQLDMKNETQQPKNIKDVYTENYHLNFNTNTHRMNSSIAPTGETGKRRTVELNSTPNIFLAQNKGKGPPGRQRSPVVIKPNRFHKPVRFDKTNDIISDPHSLPSNFGLRSFHPNDFETITDKKNDDYKFYKFNFSQLLNSIFMKKQLFILILAVFASVSVLFGQQTQQVTNVLSGAADFPTINNVSCGVTAGTPEELEPIAGKKYTYTVNITPVTGQTYRWFVTNATTLVDATAGLNTTGADPGNGTGSYILAVGTIANYNQAAGTSNTIDLTWKSFTDDPVFLVVYSTNPTNGCADNIQAWKIKPRNGFTLDLANIGADGKDKGADYITCVSSVKTAVWNATAKAIDMNYGINYLFYSVSANNFGDAWKPSVKLDLAGYEANRTISVDWAYGADATAATGWKPMTLSGGVYSSAAADYAESKLHNASVDGSKIVIRVTINHMNQESLAAGNVTLAVDGEMFGWNGTAYVAQGHDVATAAWTSPTAPYTGACGTEDGYDNDHIKQILNPRPTIVESNPANPSFVPKQ